MDIIRRSDPPSFAECIIGALLEALMRYGLEVAWPMRELHRLRQSGCSEAEVRVWFLKHVTEFPRSVRDQILEALAADALHEAEEELAHETAKRALKRRFMELWDRQGFSAALTWIERQRL
jgi:hypothetical protein